MSSSSAPLPGGGGLVGVAIRQPVFTTMVMVGLIVLGTFSFRRLSVDRLPDVSIPVISVRAEYPGASPDTVEREVTKKIEEAVNTTQGIRQITSTSLEGVSTISASFDLGVKAQWAAADVRSKIQQIQRDLPAGIATPLVQPFDPSAEPVLSLALASDTSSLADLTEFADGPLRRAIEGVDGVGRVDVSGGLRREVHVELQPDRMLAFGLGVSAVLDALADQNVETPAGRVSDRNRELLVRVVGRITRPDQFGEVVVAERGGEPIRLSRLARISEGTEEPRSGAYVDGKPAVGVDLLKVSGANTVSVAEGVTKVVDRLTPSLPKGVTLRVVRDNAVQIRASVRAVEEELLLGALLTILVVFLFLRDGRATTITSLALPVSVISAFILLYALSFTLNILTLMALSLSIGLLIDDAIVVIENIVRRYERGEDLFTAAFNGTQEIFLAVMATTLSIVAVFVPVAFMGGAIGKFFYQFGLTVAWAVLVSLFVSFTMTPMLAAWWKSSSPHKRRPRGHGLFGKIELFYRDALSWVLRHRLATVAVAALATVASLALVPLVGASVMPEQDDGEFTVNLEAPEGSSLEYTKSRAIEIEGLLRSLPGAVATYTTIGTGSAATVSRGSVYVKLAPAGSRKVSQQQVMENARAVLRRLYGVGTTVLITSSVLPRTGGREATKPIQVVVGGPSIEVLRELSGTAAKVLQAIPGVVEVSSSLGVPSPEARIVVDPDRAEAFGLDPARVARDLPVYVAGKRATSWQGPSGDERAVIVRLPEADRKSLPTLDELPLPIGPGTSIRLDEVAVREKGSSTSQIDREGLARVARVTANLVSGVSLSRATEQLEAHLAAIPKPAGYTFRLAGDSQELAETAGHVTESLLLGVIMIYLILASQFGSFLQPLAIMLSLPLSLIGVMLALLSTGDTLNMMSMIGVIMLMGLVTKNAILLVDNANQRCRRSGIPLANALLAAGETRLRPIVMTTLAMIFGMAPIAIGMGEGASFRARMARAVIGGLITSTLLTLLVVPVVVSYLDSFTRWWSRRVLGVDPEELGPT